ncbi:MAG: recombination regulator RecX [Dehalococcoidia bacterium]|nr:recombination regulator RecX [Dehalococcoidia bacterium]
MKRRGVAAVSIDGGDEPVLLPLDTVILHHLREGNHLSPEEWRTATDEGRRLLAVRKALDLVARRHRTERELTRALARLFEADFVSHAVERMRTLGYLDDAVWAKTYVESPRAADRGRAMLKHELGQRGIADPIVVAAVASHDDAAAAVEAARKRARALRRVEEPKRSRRLYDFLRRRGFADGIARDATAGALRDLDAALHADSDADRHVDGDIPGHG